jgi:hypothetical protein
MRLPIHGKIECGARSRERGPIVYSCRTASKGSTRAARRAGTHLEHMKIGLNRGVFDRFREAVHRAERGQPDVNVG